MNWGEFFAMGGYAFYVWSAWGLTTVVLGFLFTRAKVRNAKIRRQILRQLTREKIAASNVSNTVHDNAAESGGN